jgi:hypothetical protein
MNANLHKMAAAILVAKPLSFVFGRSPLGILPELRRGLHCILFLPKTLDPVTCTAFSLSHFIIVLVVPCDNVIKWQC